MIKHLLFIIIFSITLISCNSVAHLRTDNTSSHYSSTNPSKIQVYSTSKINRQYEILGEVVANCDAGENASKSVGYLQEEAAELGADAIINLKLEFDYGAWDVAIKATGTAVKLK